MRTRKWSALLAAVIAMTGLSNITLAADYTTGLTGSYRKDNRLVKGDGSSVKKSGIVRFMILADAISPFRLQTLMRFLFQHRDRVSLLTTSVQMEVKERLRFAARIQYQMAWVMLPV